MTTAAAPHKNGSAPPAGGSALSVSLTVACIAAIIAGAIYLLKTNPHTTPWVQGYDPTGMWWLSTLFAAMPVVVLLGAMAIFHLKAHVAAVVGLLTALTMAIVVYHMPVRLALTTTVYGAGYGLFPICWIILPVIFLYQLTVKTGRFTALQESLTNITEDGRLQLLLIAFALGAFFEGASGFGTPVAVCGAILISLGFRPIQAAGLSLIANTAPVAFGALGIPLITLAAVTGLDLQMLTKMTAIILVPFCMLVPFWLIWVYAGFKAMMEVWPAILVAAVTFSLAQYFMAANFGPSLVAIVAAASTIVVLITFLHFWKPKRVLNAQGEDITHQARQKFDHSAGHTFKAWLPWLVLSVVVFAWGMPQVNKPIDKATTIAIPVEGLHLSVSRIPPVVAKPTAEAAVYKLNWAAATGTGIFIAAILSGFLMGLGPISLFADIHQDSLHNSIHRHHDRGHAGVGLHHPILRSGCNDGLGFRSNRGAVSLLRHADRLAGNRDHRLRHFVERVVRQPAKADRAADRRLTHSDGIGQLGWRRDGQDDRRAEHRRSFDRNPAVRAGGLDSPLRLLAQPWIGRLGRRVRLPARLCLPN